jgi:predicted dehydrogenase
MSAQLRVGLIGVKGVFLEKPVGCPLREVDEMIAAAERDGVAVAVNHVRSFEPGYRRAAELISGGEIGDVAGRWPARPTCPGFSPRRADAPGTKPGSVVGRPGGRADQQTA